MQDWRYAETKKGALNKRIKKKTNAFTRVYRRYIPRVGTFKLDRISPPAEEEPL